MLSEDRATWVFLNSMIIHQFYFQWLQWVSRHCELFHSINNRLYSLSNKFTFKPISVLRQYILSNNKFSGRPNESGAQSVGTPLKG